MTIAAAKERVDRALGWVLVALMAASVLNVLWQVFTRFALGAPSSYTEELARFLLIWVGVLGAGYAAGSRVHLALELLPEKLRGRRRLALEVFVDASVLAFAVSVLLVGGSRLVFLQLTLGQTSAALHLPLGWVYAVLPLTGLVTSFYTVADIGEQIRRWRRPGAAGAAAPAVERRRTERDLG